LPSSRYSPAAPGLDGHRTGVEVEHDGAVVGVIVLVDEGADVVALAVVAAGEVLPGGVR
jgi:hypothetical protein